ncbi:hypothetical protein R1flu_006627 [Riccia fluitans]|uniref:Bromo domain-containing protein n=1 Tax=Riccia fluitans TaxID=41844 RepID=A0ABD1YWJ3_9MARC
MADKDKKKLKVILKLPKTHLKSPATTTTATLLTVAQQAAAPNSSNSAFSAPSTPQFSSPQVNRKNAASSHHHAGSSSSAPQGHIVSNVLKRFAANVSASDATATPGPGPASNVSSQQLTPPKKRKFKKQVSLDAKTDTNSSGTGVPQGSAQQAQLPAQPTSKPLLDSVLDKLQKKDTYGVFAEPVDAEQVPDYYDVIKEPMDFGTMRKKINKGSYTSVEVFEDDIYLICSNAMRYNGPETIYYKQARSIREMAKKAVEALKGQLAGEVRKPVSHKKKPPAPKKPLAKKPTPSKSRFDGASSDFASGATLAADGEGGGWSNSTVDAGKAKKGVSMEKLVSMCEDSQSEWAVQPGSGEAKADGHEDVSGAVAKTMGPKDGRRPLSTDEYHRNTYKPRLLPAYSQGPPLAAVGGELRQLVPAGLQVEHAYAKSLARFGAVLPPNAWRFVAQKLEKILGPSVPFGPGWVGEIEAPADVRKQLAARRRTGGPLSPKNGGASTAATTMQVTGAQLPAATFTSAAAPSYISGPAAAASASPAAVPSRVYTSTNGPPSDGTPVPSSVAATGVSAAVPQPVQSFVQPVSGSVGSASPLNPGQHGGSMLHSTSTQPGLVTSTASNITQSGPPAGAMFNFPSRAMSGSPVKFSPGPLKSSSGLGSQPSGQSAPGAQQTLAGAVGQSGITTGPGTSFSPGIPKSSLAGITFPSFASGSAQAICVGPSTIYPSISAESVPVGSNVTGYSAGNLNSAQGTGAMHSYSVVQSGLGVGSVSSYSSGHSGPAGGFTAGSGNSGPEGGVSTFPAGAAQPGVAGGKVLNFSAGVSQPGPGFTSVHAQPIVVGVTGYSGAVGQSTLATGTATGALQSAQVAGSAGYSTGTGPMGNTDVNPDKHLLSRSQHGGVPVTLSDLQVRSGSVDESGNSSVSQNLGLKPCRNVDGGAAAGDGFGGGRPVWPSLGATPEQLRAVNLMTAGNAFPREWTSEMVRDPMYALAFSSIGREDGTLQANVQKWTHEQVRNLAQQQAQQQAHLQAQQQAKQLVQQQAQQQAHLQAQQQAKQAHLQAQQQAHQQAQLQANQQAQQHAQLQAQQQAQQQAQLKAQQQAQQQAQLQAQQRAQLQAQQQAHIQAHHAQLQEQQQAQQQVQLQAKQHAQLQAQQHGQQQVQQAYQQAQHQGEAMKFAPSAQVFHSQASQRKLAPGLPQILPQMFEYNRNVLQNAGMIPPMSAGQAPLQQLDPSMVKVSAAESLGSPPTHSQSSLRPVVSLQQASVPQRSMPPDLNVALQSPTALQSPPAQQTSAAQSSQQPDLKLQL